jgi:hypothetical protein
MRVYIFTADADKYQEISFDDDEYDLDHLDFVGDKKKDTWIQPKNYYIPNMMCKRGSFLDVDGTLMFSTPSDVLKSIRHLLPPETEEIKLDYKKEELYLLNFTYMLDCLDYKKSTLWDWQCKITTTISEVKSVRKYAFDPAKFTTNSIFRLKAGNSLPVSLYCYEGVKENPEEEFKGFVEKYNLEGLRFDLVWDSEKEPFETYYG